MPHQLTDDTVCALDEGHAGEHEPRPARDFVQDFNEDEYTTREDSGAAEGDAAEVEAEAEADAEAAEADADAEAEATDDAEAADETADDDRTVAELQDELRSRNLPVSGNRDELVARLRDDDNTDNTERA